MNVPCLSKNHVTRELISAGLLTEREFYQHFFARHLVAPPPLEFRLDDVSSNLDTRYFPVVYAHQSWSKDKFQRALRGQIVVDLGAGPRADGFFFAARAEASAYLGVDCHHHGSLQHALSEDSLERIKAWSRGLLEEDAIGADDQLNCERYIPRAVSPHDMLSALRTLPPSSVSIVCSALHHLIDSSEYMKLVGIEMYRVLHKKGSIFLYNASSITPRHGGPIQSERLGAITRYYFQ